MAVFSAGDQAIPKRGSKFKLLGKYMGEPCGQMPWQPNKSKTLVRPLTSSTTEYFSQRMPRFRVKFFRSFHSSWKYGSTNVCRKPRLHQEERSENESSWSLIKLASFVKLRELSSVIPWFNQMRRTSMPTLKVLRPWTMLMFLIQPKLVPTSWSVFVL